MRNFKKKLLVCLAACLILSLFTVSVCATEDKLPPMLFDTDEIIKYNPYGGGDGGIAWQLMGPDSIENVNREYPISFTNSSDRDTFYYVAGSNNVAISPVYENLVAFLDNDFVVEYELEYGARNGGHISVALAYNYEYYIDAYISGDGTGDICIVTPSGEKSVMDSESILSSKSADDLLVAIYGKGKSVRFADAIMVSVRVTVNENKMPKRIDMYLNGCHVAYTDEGFEDEVNALTPESVDANSGYPTDKLGNLVAIRVSEDADCDMNSLYLYAVDSENIAPNENSLEYYKHTYGNASYIPKVDEDTSDETTEDITENESADESVEESDTSDILTSDGATDESTLNGETNTDAEEISTDEGDIEGGAETTDIDATDDATDAESEETTTGAKKNDKNYDDDDDGYELDVIPTLCLVFGIASGALVVIAIVILKLRTKKK